MNWVAFLTRSKGNWHLLRRIWAILSRYGTTPARMNRAVEQLHQLLETHHCSGTFPITAVALQRHPEIIRRLADRGVEFAVHGYVHVDHSQLSPEIQCEQLSQALRVFSNSQIPCHGFRSPYLHWNSATLAAVEAHGLLYESNQPIVWDVVNGQPLSQAARAAYERALEFYAVKPAAQFLSLPRLSKGLVHIPVALPDDEMLVDRLDFKAELIGRAWQSILDQTYEQGELFTLSLHPERTGICYEGLAALLTSASTRQPSVWLAQLREVADWWRRRQTTLVQCLAEANETYALQIQGPAELTILARGVMVEAAVEPWYGHYSRVTVPQFRVHCASRPVIGLAPEAAPNLVEFLREVGYLVEISQSPAEYGLYLDQQTFMEVDEKPLVERIENSDIPLIRLGPWPSGARSALSITGDIDALTLWDFGLRFLGA